ncbi:DUF5996 family protein [Nostoc sp. C117]|uniref:DUF5996 family protein n=1 Tax=Nostoc sp. C117 TaxID=3349875 RepID=UPI00370D5D04
MINTVKIKLKHKLSNLKSILPYEAVRQANDSDAMVLTFLQTTYKAAANLAQWDRAALDYAPVLKS